MRGTMLIISCTVAIVSGAVVLFARPVHRDTLPIIEIPLGGRVENIKGLTWFELRPGELSDWMFVQDPTYVILYLDKGQRRFEAFVNSLSLTQEKGRVRHADLVVSMEPVTFPEALDQAKKLIVRLGIENEENVLRDLPEWEKELYNEDRLPVFSTGAYLSNMTHVYLEIKRTLFFQPPKRWYVHVEFSAERGENLP